MAANSEVVRGRDPVRLPAWVVIGVTLALAGALAVLSIFERDTATPPPSDPVGITQEVSGNARDVETAELKAAVGQRFSAEQSSTQDAPTAAEPTISYTADNNAPIMIDGKLCGQCR